jgi:hypothetical protein
VNSPGLGIKFLLKATAHADDSGRACALADLYRRREATAVTIGLPMSAAWARRGSPERLAEFVLPATECRPRARSPLHC